MVRPANFGFNPETAVDNLYQQKDNSTSSEIHAAALKEFDSFVEALLKEGIEVIVAADNGAFNKPDAVFPNNWFSTHEDGRLLLYPMRSPNRRRERRSNLVDELGHHGFKVEEIVDLSFFEEDAQYLEGTGSLVLDRTHKIAYACKSDRTSDEPLHYFERLMGYETVAFTAVQSLSKHKTPVYHTNVMMHIGKQLSVICLDSIVRKAEKQKVKEKLESTRKKIVPITMHQKHAFAGNMLELHNKNGENFTVMSKTAFESLKPGQKQLIQKFSGLIIPDIPTIEKVGGGGVRCMMAEIFLPKRLQKTN